jgi:O-antigen/teichoic acid export membrane protein
MVSLRLNFSWTLAGNIVYAGCQWALFIVLAKIGSPEMVGQFALGLAITAPVLIFTNLQLRSLQATDAKHEYLLGHYLALRIVTTALGLLVIAAIAFCADYSLTTAATILAVGLAKAFEAGSDVYHGLLQKHERMDIIAQSLMLKGLGSVAALAGGVYLTRSAVGGALGVALVSGLSLVFYDIPRSRWVHKVLHTSEGRCRDSALLERLAPCWEWPTLVRLTWLALPLGAVMMLLSLNANIPRYVVEAQLGEGQLGIFAALNALTAAGSIVATALGQAASPRLAQYHAQGRGTGFAKLMLQLVGINLLMGVALVLAALVAGSELLTWMFTPEYAAYADVLVWVMVAGGLWQVASALGYSVSARRQFRYQPLAALVALITSAVACYMLVPGHGQLGAALAMAASSAVGVVVYAILLTIRDRANDH